HISSKKISSSILTVILILSSLTIIFVHPSLAAAGPGGPGTNWSDPWSNSMNQNYNPQTQLTEANVATLGATWIFPFPTLTTSAGKLATQGPGAPPIVVDGIVYQAANDKEVYAFDASSGKVLWHFTPSFIGGGQEHAVRYYDGKVWEMAPDSKGYNDVIGIDVLTG